MLQARCVICQPYQHTRKQRRRPRPWEHGSRYLEPKMLCLHQKKDRASSGACLVVALQRLNHSQQLPLILPTWPLQSLYHRPNRGPLRSTPYILTTDRERHPVIIRTLLVSRNPYPRCHSPLQAVQARCSQPHHLSWPRSPRPSSGDARSPFQKPRNPPSCHLTLRLPQNRSSQHSRVQVLAVCARL